MAVNLRGKKYSLEWTRGSSKPYCTSPHRAKPRIVLAKHAVDEEMLYDAIHEGLHACLWDLDEEAVHETAEGLQSLLWALGFRRGSTD